MKGRLFRPLKGDVLEDSIDIELGHMWLTASCLSPCKNQTKRLYLHLVACDGPRQTGAATSGKRRLIRDNRGNIWFTSALSPASYVGNIDFVNLFLGSSHVHLK